MWSGSGLGVLRVVGAFSGGKTTEEQFQNLPQTNPKVSYPFNPPQVPINMGKWAKCFNRL
jgi:hypothetical protein